MITIILTFLLYRYFIKRGKEITAILCIAAGAIIILAVPIQGYHEGEIIEEVELLNVATASDEVKYVVKLKGEDYKYKRVKAKEQAIVEYVYNDEVKVVIIEDEQYVKPVLHKTIKKPRRGLFTFVIGMNKTEYIFYIPENTSQIE